MATCLAWLATEVLGNRGSVEKSRLLELMAKTVLDGGDAETGAGPSSGPGFAMPGVP